MVPAPRRQDRARQDGPRRGRVRRGLVWLVQACGFAAELADELVTAWLGVPPVLPRLRVWRLRLVTEWRAYRAGVTEAEVVDDTDGVWR
jgi:hypothetical protein